MLSLSLDDEIELSRFVMKFSLLRLPAQVSRDQDKRNFCVSGVGDQVVCRQNTL